MVGKMNMKIVVGMKQKIVPVVDIKLDELNYRKIKRLNHQNLYLYCQCSHPLIPGGNQCTNCVLRSVR